MAERLYAKFDHCHVRIWQVYIIDGSFALWMVMKHAQPGYCTSLASRM
jgi:hypothetical protein